MTSYLLRRFVASLILLLVVLTTTFLVIHLAPGDPTTLLQDPRLSRQHQEELRRLYGLDRPLPAQYFGWLRSVVIELDWGISFVHRRPVTRVILDHLPQTVLLAGTALLLQFGIGILGGVAAARHPSSPKDHLLRVGSLLLYSVPLFWLGLMALLLLSHKWPLFPPGHMRSVGAQALGPGAQVVDLLHHLALPSLVLGLAGSGAVVRFTRNSVLETLSDDYVRTARAKGLPEAQVVWRHGLPNALPPLIQLFGLSLPFVLSGSLIIEVVFSWPGIGRLTYDAILSRDYPLILATTALTGSLVVVGNLLADLIHAAVDPRVRQWSR